MVLINLFRVGIETQTCGHSRGRRGWDKVRKQRCNIHITICKADSWWEVAVSHRELNPELSDNLEGSLGGRLRGRFKREGTRVYLCLIHAVWQKPYNTIKQLSFD